MGAGDYKDSSRKHVLKKPAGAGRPATRRSSRTMFLWIFNLFSTNSTRGGTLFCWAEGLLSDEAKQALSRRHLDWRLASLRFRIFRSYLMGVAPYVGLGYAESVFPWSSPFSRLSGTLHVSETACSR